MQIKAPLPKVQEQVRRKVQEEDRSPSPDLIGMLFVALSGFVVGVVLTLVFIRFLF
jgi:hypothetical protein